MNSLEKKSIFIPSFLISPISEKQKLILLKSRRIKISRMLSFSSPDKGFFSKSCSEPSLKFSDNEPQFKNLILKKMHKIQSTNLKQELKRNQFSQHSFYELKVFHSLGAHVAIHADTLHSNIPVTTPRVVQKIGKKGQVGKEYFPFDLVSTFYIGLFPRRHQSLPSTPHDVNFWKSEEPRFVQRFRETQNLRHLQYHNQTQPCNISRRVA